METHNTNPEEARNFLSLTEFRHIAPLIEDFQNALKTGADNTSIQNIKY